MSSLRNAAITILQFTIHNVHLSLWLEAVQVPSTTLCVIGTIGICIYGRSKLRECICSINPNCRLSFDCGFNHVVILILTPTVLDTNCRRKSELNSFKGTCPLKCTSWSRQNKAIKYERVKKLLQQGWISAGCSNKLWRWKRLLKMKPVWAPVCP